MTFDILPMECRAGLIATVNQLLGDGGWFMSGHSGRMYRPACHVSIPLYLAVSWEKFNETCSFKSSHLGEMITMSIRTVFASPTLLAEGRAGFDGTARTARSVI